MGFDIELPVHIEFYGLPGSGKSTVSHMLAKKLRKAGYTVFEPTYSTDHGRPPFIRRMKKLFQAASFSLFHFRSVTGVIRLLKLNNYSSAGMIRQLCNILPKLKVYAAGRSGIYIWDEGLIQSSVSLSLFSMISAGRNHRQLTGSPSIKKHMDIPVYVTVNEEEAAERLERRTVRESRAEGMPRQKQIRLLKKISGLCNEVCPDNAYRIQSGALLDMEKELFCYICSKL